MYRYLLLIIPLLGACKPNAETYEVKKGLSISHEQKIISKTVEDEMSPLGYWETHIEYPILKESKKNASLGKINNATSTIANKFRCDDDKGDKQFKAAVTLLNETVTSIQFTDTWLCAGMPHPDARTGAVTYNIKTGELVSIDDELIDSIKAEFSQNIVNRINRTLKTEESDGSCKQASTWSHFYLVKNGLVFVYAPDEYSEQHCISEIKIDIKEVQPYLNKESILLSSG
jgi:hypothetical protein